MLAEESDDHRLSEVAAILRSRDQFVIWCLRWMFIRGANNALGSILWRVLGSHNWEVETRGSLAGVRVRGRYSEFADLDAIREVFARRIYEIGNLACRPTHIVDAGAHIGCFSLLSARTFPGVPIEAFEPSSTNYRLLERNLARNGVPGARLHRLALSDREGSARLASGSSMGRRISETEGEPVEMACLSRVLGLPDQARLLIKLDVEGAEWAVLSDATSVFPRDTHLFLETHGGAADRARLHEYAAEHGFMLECTKEDSSQEEWVLQRGSFVPEGRA